MMAITGTGTEQDPYTVHDYTELRQLSSIRHYSGMLFAKLANDINCNDYGADFEWEQVTIGDGVYSGMTMVLDLDNHTIKNVSVKQNNNMFYLETYSDRGSCIKNGKILNVFTSGAKAILEGKNNSYNSIESLSISVNTTGSTYVPFTCISIISCAIYALTYLMKAPFFYACICRQSDLYFDVKEVNYYYPDGSCTFSYCRIRGTISGSAGFSGHSNNMRTTFNNNFSNCVIEVDNTDWYREGAQFNYAPDPLIYGFNSSTNVCLINKDKICDSNKSSWQFMTTEQIRDADYINSKGFVVVEVGD